MPRATVKVRECGFTARARQLGLFRMKPELTLLHTRIGRGTASDKLIAKPFQSLWLFKAGPRVGFNLRLDRVATRSDNGDNNSPSANAEELSQTGA